MTGADAADPGLCGTCRWARVVATRRGSQFWLCGRSATDPRFPRYPRLPVLRCMGYEAGEAGDETRGEET